MELLLISFVIIVFFLFVGFFLKKIYIPAALQPLAEIAGFQKFSYSYMVMKQQDIPVDFLFQQYVKAIEVSVALDFKDLRDFYLTFPQKTENIIDALIRAKRAGVKLNINELERFQISGGDPLQLVKALKTVKNAGLNISRKILESHSLYGGNINTFVEIILRANKAYLEINIQNLVEENLSDSDMKKIVNILIKAQKAGLYITEEVALKDEKEPEEENLYADLRISLKGILEHFRAKIDIDKYARAMIKAKKSGIKINKNALNIHYLTDGDIEKLVSTMIKVKKSEIDITQKELVQYNIEDKDIGKIVDNFIKAKRADLDITTDDIINFYRIGGDSERLIKALIIDKKAGLGVGRKKLVDYFLAGVDVIKYVKCINFIEKNKEFGITEIDISNHYLKGGDPMKALSAISYARVNNIQITPSTAFAIDLSPSTDIDKIIQWAINPEIKDVKPFATVVAKDGIQISLKMRVTVRGKIKLWSKGSREKVLFGRINEATAEEIPKYDSYKSILKNLNKISDNVLKRLLGKIKISYEIKKNKSENKEEIREQNEKEKKLNKSSAYEILDIKIFDIIVGKDTLAEHKLHHAEHTKNIAKIHLKERIINAQAEEAEAKARLTVSKARIQEGMAEAFRKGNFNFRDYQKEKHIFDSFDEETDNHGAHDSHHSFSDDDEKGHH